MTHDWQALGHRGKFSAQLSFGTEVFISEQQTFEIPMKTIHYLAIMTLLGMSSARALDPVELAAQKRAKAAFNALDKDNNESLSYEEFSTSRLLADQKEREVKALFREFDSKRDEKITLEEFIKGVKNERREHAAGVIPRGWRFFRR